MVVADLCSVGRRIVNGGICGAYSSKECDLFFARISVRRRLVRIFTIPALDTAELPLLFGRQGRIGRDAAVRNVFSGYVRFRRLRIIADVGVVFALGIGICKCGGCLARFLISVAADIEIFCPSEHADGAENL